MAAAPILAAPRSILRSVARVVASPRSVSYIHQRLTVRTSVHDRALRRMIDCQLTIPGSNAFANHRLGEVAIEAATTGRPSGAHGGPVDHSGRCDRRCRPMTSTG